MSQADQKSAQQASAANDSAKREPAKQPWNLIPLTPEYLEAEHGVYVEALEDALENRAIRNIALSGNYGVGKSSVLRELGRRLDGRVVELSLSTLAPVKVSKDDVEVPPQALTPTNRIQKEIVKQLLYREDPRKTPASRFRRIETFHWWREAGIAALLGFVVAIIFLLTGWTSKIVSAIPALVGLNAWVHLGVWAVATGVVLSTRRLCYGKLRIKQFTAGAATVTLDDTSVSYFDQYLDEIVYFFEASDLDVVIFEDIDRFNDSHIFETLRTLNNLLNTSPQIKEPIRFIYAIRDSIFDRIWLKEEGRDFETSPSATEDSALAEAVRANRTKFFDLVIPVVPFITHRSARDLATQVMAQIDHKVDQGLLDLASKYVPDMRLLKNIRNEFIVFRDRIFSGEGKELDLSETELFAMMLYKSTHLTDFENIRLGKSNLDVLYELSRNLVAENIKQIETDCWLLRYRLDQIDGVKNHSEELGKWLLGHMLRTARAIGYDDPTSTGSFEFDGETFDSISDAEFWKSFFNAPGDPELKWNMRPQWGRTFTFIRSDIVAAFRDRLIRDVLDAEDEAVLNERLTQNTRDIDFLGNADLVDLLAQPKFPVNYKGKACKLDSVAEELLGCGLAYKLIRAGYINRNFTLYTSTFHGDRVSSVATNFIIHHVERDLMDMHFNLEASDVDAIVEECGIEELEKPAFYNISILDHLLAGYNTDAGTSRAADIMIRSFDKLEERQIQFLDTYLSIGENALQLVQLFARLSQRVLLYLLSRTELELSETLKIELVDTALANLSSDVQDTDANVVNYLQAHCVEFPVLTDYGKPDQAERVAELFAAKNIVIPNLKSLSASARTSFISRNLYEITHENLSIVINNDETVGLDTIRDVDRNVYGYVVDNLHAYLDAVADSSATIDDCEQFGIVLEDLSEQELPLLDTVIKRASSSCQIAELGSVPERLWPVLAQDQRFPATFSNVNLYVGSQGIDESLSLLLSRAGEISKTESVDEEDKVTLATKFLEAREQLLDAKLRVDLVVSLRFNAHLNIGEITAEKGELFALLVKHDVIEDNAEVYQHLMSTDWLTRKLIICDSSEFENYMTPRLVEGDLTRILEDDGIPEVIKRAIVKKAEDYVEVADEKALVEIARCAVDYEERIPLDVITTMVAGGVPSEYIVVLLESHLQTIERVDLFEILDALGGEYSKLTSVGAEVVRVPNTQADRALLDGLKEHGIVNTYTLSKDEVKIKVNRKRKSK
ncbi:hypothetical protein ACRQF6_05915 [Actinotignum sp. GS-2025f]|uniref:YobI family P-loop NTPase n=1 Tax=unclassified Actinotignum TaxID=2632702 RepID=UPI002A7FFE60|nr:hypothetical protein [Actinotignum sp. SLA_B059]MDY5128251.1 hypothetical protein [Actinotignum sp. SLA_B059]